MAMQKILEIVVKRIKYPSWYQYDEGNATEFEEEYRLYREELATLFQNLASNKFFHESLLQTLATLFSSIRPPMTPFNEAEVVLYLAYNL